MFAINKQITAINGKTGSIPFSGKSIPPDKFCTQYTNIPINKAFITMLMLFSMICLFLFLKLNKLNAPIKTKTIDEMLIIGRFPKTSTSCPVIYRNAAAKTESKIQIVCILCNIEFKFRSKNNINFAQFKNKCRFAIYNVLENKSHRTYFSYSQLITFSL